MKQMMQEGETSRSPPKERIRQAPQKQQRGRRQGDENIDETYADYDEDLSPKETREEYNSEEEKETTPERLKR